MAKTSAIPGWQLAVLILTGTVVGVVVVSCLYWAQTVFIPVALAVFLTFLLAPLVTVLQRRGLGRLPSVLLVVCWRRLLLGGGVWLVTAQVTSLAGEVPKYTENIKGKVKSLRHLGQGSVTGTPGEDDPGHYRGVESAARRASEGEDAGQAGGWRPRRSRPPWCCSRRARPGWRGCRPCSVPCWRRSAAWPWPWCWSSSCC